GVWRLFGWRLRRAARKQENPFSSERAARHGGDAFPHANFRVADACWKSSLRVVVSPNVVTQVGKFETQGAWEGREQPDGTACIGRLEALQIGKAAGCKERTPLAQTQGRTIKPRPPFGTVGCHNHVVLLLPAPQPGQAGAIGLLWRAVIRGQ